MLPLRSVPQVEPSLDHDLAVTLVSALSEAFGVPSPTLKWEPRVTRAGYRRDWMRGEGGVIRVGPKVWRGVYSLLHEFAHHLADCRAGRKIHHGTLFCEALRDTAKASLGLASLFPWETEYPGVYQWWVRQTAPNRTVYAQAEVRA